MSYQDKIKSNQNFLDKDQVNLKINYLDKGTYNIRSNYLDTDQNKINYLDED